MSPTTTNQPLDQETQQLTDLLSFLHIAMKNIRLYPAGHDLVKNRTKAAYQLLTKLLAKNNTLIFGVARDTITYGEKNLGEDSTSCTSFAKALSRNEIATLSFNQGVSQHSLFTFLKAVGILPEHRLDGKTLEQELDALNIPHIIISTVNYMDFDRVQDSSEDEEGKQLAEELPTDTATWLEFTTRLTDGALGRPQSSGNTISSSTSPDPVMLATAINAHALKQPDIVQQFSFHLDQMLRQDNPSQPSLNGGELNTILTSLSPQIRDQFLKTTLQKCDQNRDKNNSERLLGKFSHSLIGEMLQLITNKDVAVSPSLLHLIQNLSRIRFTADSAAAASAMDTQKLKTLLEPEKYDQYVGKDYRDTLDQLSSDQSTESFPTVDFPLEQHLVTLEDKHLNRQIVRATLIFMEGAEEESEYTELANRLMEFTRQLPEAGEFGLLLNIAKTLMRHAAKKDSTTMKNTATGCIEELTDAEFLDYVYSIMMEPSARQEEQKAILFFISLGSGILGKLVKIFCMQQSVDEDNPLLTVFKKFRLETLTAIFTILPKENASRIKKLLGLVGYLGAGGTAPLLHPLLAHDDTDIQLQVLNLLIPLNDKKSIDTLNSMLGSKNDIQIEAAIELCNEHKPVESVPALLDLLEYQFIKETAIARNRKLILLLGRIGDKRALPALEKIAFSKWPLHRKQVNTMKRILFYSLKGYNHEDRINLVRRGTQIKDEEIQKICTMLLAPQQRS